MNAMRIIAVLALVACANAGYLEHPVFHSHGPVVKHIHPEIYAVPPPILAKPVVYAHPAPVVKVFHAPAPIVKTLSIGPLGYGAYDHHHHHGYHGHGYHHGHAYHGHGYHHGHAYHGHPFLF